MAAEGVVDTVDHGVLLALQGADVGLEELGATLDGLQPVLGLGEVSGETGVDHPAEGLGLLLVLDA